MIEALKSMADDSEENKDKKFINIDTFKTNMEENGEKMQVHEVEEILQDIQELINGDEILIEDFAKYLMSR
mgnify:CR=1 FL=1